MKTVFLAKFSKDLDKLDSKQVKESVKATILEIEKAGSILDVLNVKKLKGHRTAYRIRIGDYRIGLFIDNDTVSFARFVHRKEIYNVFP